MKKNLIFKKAHYDNNRIAVMIYTELGERYARLTMNLEDVPIELFGDYSMILHEECPEDVIRHLAERGYIDMIGVKFDIDGYMYRLAIADKNWFESLEEYQRGA